MNPNLNNETPNQNSIAPQYVSASSNDLLKKSKTKKLLVIVIFTLILLGITIFIIFAEIGRRSFKETTVPASNTNQTSISEGKPSLSRDQKAQDSESRTDTNATYGQLEAFHATNGSYPGLADLNNPGFVNINMRGLDIEALKTPVGTQPEFVSSAPTLQNYSYVPTQCDKSGKQCLSYTLSALLNSGDIYTKTALN